MDLVRVNLARAAASLAKVRQVKVAKVRMERVAGHRLIRVGRVHTATTAAANPTRTTTR